MLLLGLMGVVLLLRIFTTIPVRIMVVVGVVIRSPTSSSSSTTTAASTSSSPAIRISVSAPTASIVHHRISHVSAGRILHMPIRTWVVWSTIGTTHLHVRRHASWLHGINSVWRTTSYLLRPTYKLCISWALWGHCHPCCKIGVWRK